MSGFDQARVFTSVARDAEGEEGIFENDSVDLIGIKKQFKEFLRTYHHQGSFNYKYRDTLRRNYNTGQYFLEIDLGDLGSYDSPLVQTLCERPTEYLPILEEAAKEVADEVTAPRPPGQEQLKNVQIMLCSPKIPMLFRELKSHHVSQLVKVSGIVLSTTGIRSKAVKMSLMCRSCRSVEANIDVKPGLDGYALPRKCRTNQGSQAGDLNCPLDPYFIIPDKCECVDFQVLKLQESPEIVPSGEMPRHLQLYCDRFLCEKAVPGNRVSIVGVYSIKKAAQSMKKQTENKQTVGVRAPYLRVVGIQLDMDGSGRTGRITFSAAEEEEFRALAASPDCYERIAKSIAPSIFGGEDIKKSIACLLFGGSRKRLPDGLTRRGDINVLLLGDPGTAKSQLLKFVEKVSPIAIYTSGKGSSAAGLTASVNRDPATKNFIMEGGAMVLADGGVVCIDEFDKMREDDRVAIHEAMEQQTISIAKAGITTTLNSRCAVLAAANSTFGRWDDLKGNENIDFLPTILSRFDMIYIVKDEHNEARDTIMAKHVMRVHMNAQRDGEQQADTEEGELSLLFLKKYIAYCRGRCGPRLSEEACEKLKNRYILMRSGNRDMEIAADRKNPIPITIRQLEAITRVAEALAKMQLKPFATENHIDEAMRLFQVSTLDAANGGHLDGQEGTTREELDLLSRIETQLKRRLAIGAQVSEHTILQDFKRQKYEERSIYKVIHSMIRRGELQHRIQRKLIYRVK